MGFFYSFIQSLLHSIWQSAILLLLYFAFTPLLKKLHPLQKRNLLYFLPLCQLTASLLTFFVCYKPGAILISSPVTVSAAFPVWFADHAQQLFYLYAFVVFLRMTFIFYRRNIFYREVNRGMVRPAAALKVFAGLNAHRLGIKRKISLWYSNTIHTPLTYGFLKPVILLPFSLVNALTTAEAEAIILHELAHISNNDYLLNCFLTIAETFYFFNPFTRIIAKKIRLEQEKNCDLQVLDFEYPGLLYAEALLKAARFSNYSGFKTAAVRTRSELLQRIRFFSAENQYSFYKRFSSIFLLPFFAIIFFFLPGKKSNEVKMFAPVAAASIVEIQAPVAYVPDNPSAGIPTTTLKAPARMKITRRANVPADAPANSHDADAVNSLAYAASLSETPDSVKEIIYKIETPMGQVTRSYRLTLSKGRYKIQPRWMVLESRGDSARRVSSDTLFSEVPAVQ